MTYAPMDLRNVRGFLIRALDIDTSTSRPNDLEGDEVGIVGDPAHAASGGYHEGNDDLARVGRLSSDYSKAESPRDRPGSDAASALDIGWFDAQVGGRRLTLRDFSRALVVACERGDPRTSDIREIIWSPDGSAVWRWDRLGRRSSGDVSHRTHTHMSFFRDSEGRRDRDDNLLGLLVEIIGGNDVLTNEDIKAITQNVASAVRRGVWMGGFNDASFDPPYRGGPTLESTKATVDALLNEVASLKGMVVQLSGAVASFAATVQAIQLGGVDPAAVALALAPLLPAAPTAAEVADQVADQVADRLKE